MGLSFRRTPTWLTRQRRRERHRQWALRAAPHSGFALSSQAHREPPFSTSHSSSGGIGHPSIHNLKGRSGLLFLSRASRRSGCSSRGCAPICSRATTVDNRVTLHGTAQCHRSRASRLVSRVRSSKWLTSSRDGCTIPLLWPSLRAHQ